MSYKGLTYLFRVSLPLLSAMLVAQTAGQTLKIQDATVCSPIAYGIPQLGYE